jgi:serine/threonine protein kinase
VSLDRADTETVSSYINEINLLERLAGNDRIIRLLDSESNAKKKTLTLVMECGEIDFARLLQEKQGQPIIPHWIATYWQQMLEAVQVIHEERMVHSDLKPANFVLVKGSLKLIDFGIAKAIPNDTTNIQRDQQIGTVNYMSPEAIEDAHTLPGKKVHKLGRPSDVWSLGCILYQMIYGHPPFHALAVLHKMKAIPDNNHVIDFPALSVPTIPGPKDENGVPGPSVKDWARATPVRKDVIDMMKSCLDRDPKKRVTIPEMLAADWLNDWRSDSSSSQQTPRAPAPEPKPVLAEDEAIINPHFMKQLIRYTVKYGHERGIPSEAEVDALCDEMMPALIKVSRKI